MSVCSQLTNKIKPASDSLDLQQNLVSITWIKGFWTFCLKMKSISNIFSISSNK